MNTENNRVVLIGLCGRSGSGKGYVCSLFEELGIPSIDTDRVYRDITAPSSALSPCLAELSARFGPEVVAEDGSLDRVAMRKIVFADDSAALQDLNRITHRHILKRTMEEVKTLSKAGADCVIIDAPVLFESGFNTYCDCTVCVTAPEETVLRRIMRRDGITAEEAKKRLKTQIPASELRERTDFEIVNDTDRDVLMLRVENVARNIREKYTKEKQKENEI